LLEVHHIRYRSEGGKNHPHNLITLCKTHHEKAHSHKKAWQNTLLLAIWAQYANERVLSIPEVVRSIVGIVPDDELEETLAKFWRQSH